MIDLFGLASVSAAAATIVAVAIAPRRSSGDGFDAPGEIQTPSSKL